MACYWIKIPLHIDWYRLLQIPVEPELRDSSTRWCFDQTVQLCIPLPQFFLDTNLKLKMSLWAVNLFICCSSQWAHPHSPLCFLSLLSFIHMLLWVTDWAPVSKKRSACTWVIWMKEWPARDWEIVHWLRALTILSQDPGSISSTYMMAHNCL
jgi:hypothetical protein